jgi:hypothetical protein
MPPDERAPATVTPRERRERRAAFRGSARQVRLAAERNQTDRSTTEVVPDYIPRAGDTKIQVNPRIYRTIWSHYEQLVDELPRERRRGALTALINAVLAQHAPHDVAEARTAIAWLRRAEARDALADIGDGSHVKAHPLGAS